MIQITDDRAPNGRLLRAEHMYGWEDISSFLIQQGKERLMEIQQHDGVVVEVAGFQQGFAKRKRGGIGVSGGRGRRQGLDLAALPPPTIYRSKGEGGRSLGPSSKEGCGQGGVLPPQGTSEVPSPFRTLPFPYHLAHGPLGAGALGPYRPRRTPLQPMCPPGAGGPPWWTPGPLSALPVQYR